MITRFLVPHHCSLTSHFFDLNFFFFFLTCEFEWFCQSPRSLWEMKISIELQKLYKSLKILNYCLCNIFFHQTVVTKTFRYIFWTPKINCQKSGQILLFLLLIPISWSKISQQNRVILENFYGNGNKVFCSLLLKNE